MAWFWESLGLAVTPQDYFGTHMLAHRLVGVLLHPPVIYLESDGVCYILAVAMALDDHT